MSRSLSTLRILCLLVAATGSLAAAEPQPREADAAAIRAAGESYKQALDRGDAAALAALWTPDGDIVDDLGNVLKARDAVAASGPAAEGPKPTFRITETSLRFVSADVAIEDGTVEVTPPGGTVAMEGRFSATWVRHEGAWKLAALREARAPEPAGRDALAGLDWMVGDWVVLDGDGSGAAPVEMTMTVRWNDTRTYLLRDMKVKHPAHGDRPLEISQRIGWDPLARRIRSWAFGSDGSHAEATWLRDGQAWVAQTATVLPDGGQASSLNIYAYDGKDRCVWRSLHTHVGAEHAPPITMTMVRKAAADAPNRGASQP